MKTAARFGLALVAALIAGTSLAAEPGGYDPDEIRAATGPLVGRQGNEHAAHDDHQFGDSIAPVEACLPKEHRGALDLREEIGAL